ncbi:MAG TPA: hypothetical protein VFT16_02435 [Candidatus Saccharimonadales bacterium]|nr:hypothetical protein [Candidatus Saccharimonadales bacterium]
MSAAEWGCFDDPDTFEGVDRYPELGYELSMPDAVRNLGGAALHRLAQECGTLLQTVYKGTYPLSAKDADALHAGIIAGETNLFTLARDGELSGMAALVNQDNRLGGEITFTELGRAVARPSDGYRAGVPMRPMLKYRLPWSQENLTGQDYLYSMTRSAAEGRGGSPSGRGIQSVWWGASKHGSQIPMVTTGASWAYKLHGIEPFTGFVSPVDPEQWVGAASQHTLFTPTEADRNAVSTLLTEGTRGRVKPHVVVDRQAPAAYDFAYNEMHGPSDAMAAKYVVTDRRTPLPARSEEEVAAHLGEAISQKLVIEADVASTPRGAAIMRKLHEQGWTLAGWWPSEIEYGAVCPEFARVNPKRIEELVEPAHHPSYFDHNLPGTRRVLDNVYAKMLGAAITARENVKSTIIID